MIVVADTSPINYLILIEEIDILTKMYGRVVIPRAVRQELLRPSAPEMVRNWITQLPTWLEVHTPVNAPDASLSTLDPGERDAIMLAGELRADQLIVDDRQGRHEAEKRGIPVMGTLGVLREAAALGLLNLRIAAKRLEATSFYIAPEVLTRLLKDQP
jgi:predicted nucleic acid-binding protein